MPRDTTVTAATMFVDFLEEEIHIESVKQVKFFILEQSNAERRACHCSSDNLSQLVAQVTYPNHGFHIKSDHHNQSSDSRIDNN